MTGAELWQQAPGRTGGASSSAGARLNTAAAVIIASGGPVAWALSHGTTSAVLVLVLGIAAALALQRTPRSWWAQRLATAIALALLLAPLITSQLSLWLAFGLLLSQWSIRGLPPLPSLPPPGPGTATAVTALTAVGAWWIAMDHDGWLVAVPFAVATAAPLITRLGDGRLSRVADRVGEAAASAVSLVMFTLLGLLIVALPWSVQRPLGWDPLSRADGWERRGRRDPGASRPGGPETRIDPVTGRPERRRVLALVAVLVVAIAATPATRNALLSLAPSQPENAQPFRLADVSRGSSGDLPIRDAVDPDLAANHPRPGEVSAAMMSSTWFTDENLYNTAQGWALDPSAAWRPINPYRLLDFRSAYLTVVDGVRQSWRPPACDCKRLTVWMYGGSTTYGLNQRDEHTIASELARVAHEQGIPIDVHNRGANGHLHWMEAERFAWDLTAEEPPDLALFYDGVNDAWAGGTLNWLGIGDTKPMHDPTLIDLWERSGRSSDAAPDPPPGARLLESPTPPPLEVGEMERTIIDRYDRSRGVSRVAAEAHGVEVRYLWQPNRYSRPLVPREPHEDGTRENTARLSGQLMRSFLPEDVIDVSDALRETDEPLFTDDVHHNELGARLIAEEIFERIEGDLRRLLEENGSAG